jgi:hypothetical protein
VNSDAASTSPSVASRRLVVRSDAIFAERIGTEVVVMNLATEKVISLNAVAAAIWDLLNEGADTEAIVANVAARFAAPVDVTAADTSTFFAQLIDLGLASWES